MLHIQPALVTPASAPTECRRQSLSDYQPSSGRVFKICLVWVSEEVKLKRFGRPTTRGMPVFSFFPFPSAVAWKEAYMFIVAAPRPCSRQLAQPLLRQPMFSALKHL
ncbi:hypothetical protein RRG08_036365 [Elysia crispata]|uniref:Uncharacterized protein n=1 Tax=Elysia crispata TaxID=231223 RepID=A0AAE0ZK55_9GAST|nr:hypothetical protein RRG08_036365 [Elysia crispata]